MTRKSIVAIAALLFASLVTVSACAGITSNDETLRYKMTITIETPEGDKTGYAVREAIKHTEKSILPEQGGSFYNGRGEAISIDAAKTIKIFSLFSAESEAKLVFNHANDLKNRISVDVPLGDFPRFVRFEDGANVDSVIRLLDVKNCMRESESDAQMIKCTAGKQLKSMPREGFYVKSVRIDSTNEEITRGIKAVMPPIQDNNYHVVNTYDFYKE